MMKNMTDLFIAIIQFILGMCMMAAFITVIVCFNNAPDASMWGVFAMIIFGMLYSIFED